MVTNEQRCACMMTHWIITALVQVEAEVRICSTEIGWWPASFLATLIGRGGGSAERQLPVVSNVDLAPGTYAC